MTLSAITFVLGHELGHVLHNHTGYTRDRDANHAMEFEADHVGLSIAIRRSMFHPSILEQDTYFAKFALFGPLFALGVMSIFGDKSSVTHPSPTQRREKLLASYSSVFTEVFGEETQMIWDDVDESLQHVLESNSTKFFTLFGELRDIVRDIHLQPAHDMSWLTNSAAFTKS